MRRKARANLNSTAPPTFRSNLHFVMQAQSLAQGQGQEIVTSAQSIAAVKTLVTAGFGCMSFLRCAPLLANLDAKNVFIHGSRMERVQGLVAR